MTAFNLFPDMLQLFVIVLSDAGRVDAHPDMLKPLILMEHGFDFPGIASVVGVSLATIYRELPRGYTDERFPGGRKVYSAVKAQQTVDQNIKRRGRSPADTKKGTE